MYFLFYTTKTSKESVSSRTICGKIRTSLAHNALAKTRQKAASPLNTQHVKGSKKSPYD